MAGFRGFGKPKEPKSGGGIADAYNKLGPAERAAVDSEMHEKLSNPYPSNTTQPPNNGNSDTSAPSTEQASGTAEPGGGDNPTETLRTQRPSAYNKPAGPPNQVIDGGWKETAADKLKNSQAAKASAAGAPQRAQHSQGAPTTKASASSNTSRHGQNPPDINPNKDYGESAQAKGKGAAIAAAFIQRNPRKLLAGGGISAIIVGLVMFALSPFLAEFKLSTFMNNMTDHGFRHVTHSYAERQKIIIKEYLKEQLDPTFHPETDSIVNYDRSMIKNLYGKMRGDGRLEQGLRDAGYRIETRVDPKYPKFGHIVKISYNGETIDSADPNSLKNFEKTYSTMTNAKDAASHVDEISHRVFKDTGVFAKLTSRRLQIITGVKLHWLDKLTGPVKEIRVKMRNQVVKFILEHSGVARGAAAQILAYLTGTKIDQATSQTIGDATADAVDTVATDGVEEAGEEAVKKGMAKGMVDAMSKAGFDVSNPIGWVMLVIGIECQINKFDDTAYAKLGQIAKDKAGAEYGVEFLAMKSSLDQVHDPANNTNNDTIGAAAELLTNAAGQDFSQSNNYKRAEGQDVPYTHTDDCTQDVELCDDKRPQTMIDNTFLGKAAKRANEQNQGALGFFNNYVAFLGPNGVGTKYLCKGIDAVSGWVGDLLIGIFKVGFEVVASDQEKAQMKALTDKGAEAIMEHVFLPMIGWLLPPVVDADTRGPRLTNAVGAGAEAMAGVYMRSFCGDPTQGDPEAAKKCRLDGPDLSASEDVIHQQEIADNNALPMWERLASLDNPRSIFSQFLMSTPNSYQQLVARIGAIPQLFTIPRLVPALASAGTSFMNRDSALAAVSTDNPLGEDIYDYSEACLKNVKLNDGTNPDCKGMDKWDDVVACSMIGGETQGQGVPDGCDPDAAMNNAAAAPTAATATIDMANLYKDSTTVDCAPGTTKVGVGNGYHEGNLVKINLCAIPSLPGTGGESTPGSQYYINGANRLAIVNSRVSGAWLALATAAKKAGVNISSDSSFRTMAHQQALWNANPNPTLVARPGTSNHQMGLAIDFNTTGHNGSVWDWLDKNAATYGIKNYPAEAWHWSPTGN